MNGDYNDKTISEQNSGKIIVGSFIATEKDLSALEADVQALVDNLLIFPKANSSRENKNILWTARYEKSEKDLDVRTIILQPDSSFDSCLLSSNTVKIRSSPNSKEYYFELNNGQIKLEIKDKAPSNVYLKLNDVKYELLFSSGNENK